MPRATLTGGFGSESAELPDLLEFRGRTLIAGLSVTQPIFNAGARRAASRRSLSNGVIGYIDVLVAQRQVFDAELKLIEAMRDRHLMSVRLLTLRIDRA